MISSNIPIHHRRFIVIVVVSYSSKVCLFLQVYRYSLNMRINNRYCRYSRFIYLFQRLPLTQRLTSRHCSTGYIFATNIIQCPWYPTAAFERHLSTYTFDNNNILINIPSLQMHAHHRTYASHADAVHYAHSRNIPAN